MSITVRIKAERGREIIYPACHQSQLLSQFANKHTFTERDIELLKHVGFTVHVEATRL